MLRLASRLTLVVLLASVAQADTYVRPQGTIYSSPINGDFSQRSFTGLVTPFGPVNGHLELWINSDGSYTGQFFLFDNKGTASGTIEGQITPELTYAETLTFKAGTGKYSEISGFVNFFGMVNTLNGTAVDTVTGGKVYR